MVDKKGLLERFVKDNFGESTSCKINTKLEIIKDNQVIARYDADRDRFEGENGFVTMDERRSLLIRFIGETFLGLPKMTWVDCQTLEVEDKKGDTMVFTINESLEVVADDNHKVARYDGLTDKFLLFSY